MGCGASSQHADFGLDDSDEKYSKGKQVDDNDMVVRAVSKNRMESRYPWEMDGRQLPEDVTIIFVLGPPGSGKSTQCQRLVSAHGATHLSSGDLLRAEVESGTALGKWVNDLMQQGSLVPLQVTLTLLKKAMLSSNSPVMLIDGFPRALDQVTLFERTISPAHAVIFLDVPSQVAVARMAGRGRSDDNAASIQQQWQVFIDQTLPVRQLFSTQGRAIMIDASLPVEEVAVTIGQAYKELEATREAELEQLQAKANAEYEAKHGRKSRADSTVTEEEEEGENAETLSY